MGDVCVVVVLSVGVSSTVVRSVRLVTGDDGPLPICVIPVLMAEMDDVAGVLVVCRLLGFSVLEVLSVIVVCMVCCVVTSPASVLSKMEEEGLRSLWVGGVLETERV